MLDPNQTFKDAIAEENLKLAEIYDIELPVGVTLRYTSHSKKIMWGNPRQAYYPTPIQRSEISNNINLEMDTVNISIQNITGETYQHVNNNVFDSAKVTIKRIQWDETYAADKELTLFIGTSDISFDRSILMMNCKSIINTLNIVVPRQLYQEPCNHTLFDDNCGLTKADYKYSGTTSFNSNDQLTIIDNNLKVNLNGINPSDVTLYNLGEIKITSGGNDGVRRMIRVAAPSEISVMTPFPNPMLSDVTFDAYPGCDLRVAETCSDVFANQLNFLGFIHVPKTQETF